MIFGIGTDIIEIARVAKAMESPRFCQRVFSEDEGLALGGTVKDATGNTLNISPINMQSFAANFAGKEAVVKAMGCGFKGFFPCNVEILRHENGKPYVRLSGKAKELADTMGIRFHISLSHCQEYAVGYALAEEN